MFVEIGGIPQWIEFEGERDENPVLLIVHGGPGASSLFTRGGWGPWKRHFTLAYWDQRGAGRTYVENGPEHCRPMSFAQIVSDGLEVVDFIRSQIGPRQIFVLGHSWGSAVGIHMVKRRPDLFGAFVGTGQLVNFRENEKLNRANLLRWAREQGDAAALSTLAEIGEPPYVRLQDLATVRGLGDKLVGGAGDAVAPKPPVRPANVTPEDREAVARGFQYSCGALIDDLWAIDLPALGLDFEVPIFVFMGTHDPQTPYELAEDYFGRLKSPAKGFVRFEGCHHFVHINQPDDFLRELLAHLQPLLSDNAGETDRRNATEF
ncbi:alpha/beta hydrolase (plasmid) [Novosphingobium sp. BL-8A]|uniref:alpha/beta fold hydrolase n=1 Tax=Novosphingobium sp. BL-8A TaxID=3127639 RepID=UPI0037568344